jgi:hypothetical protein
MECVGKAQRRRRYRAVGSEDGSEDDAVATALSIQTQLYLALQSKLANSSNIVNILKMSATEATAQGARWLIRLNRRK